MKWGDGVFIHLQTCWCQDSGVPKAASTVSIPFMGRAKRGSMTQIWQQSQCWDKWGGGEVTVRLEPQRG